MKKQVFIKILLEVLVIEEEKRTYTYTYSARRHAQKYHFNIIGLLLCHFNIPYHRKHYFFCSQFVSEVLCRSHALELPKDTSLMRPSDYMKLPEMLCCFRGHLNEFTGREKLLLA